MVQTLLGIAVFTGLVLLLVLVILAARSLLLPTGRIVVLVNAERELQERAGTKLHEALAAAGILLPTSCGGKGTCGMCRVRVVSGGGSLAPVEGDLLTRREREEQVRLACQVTLRENVEVQLPEELLGLRELTCRVRSNRNVATFIKELVLELPEDEPFVFRAGGFVQLTCPPYRASFADFDVDEAFRPEWDRFDLRRLEASAVRPTTRAYSLANRPGEEGLVVLNVRIATPPPGAPASVPPGVVSSWIFSLRPGDEVPLSGPFGHFFADDSEREMVFVGGGAGMAPMRAHICDQLERLRTRRKIGFWYGARSRQELFYRDDFDRLAVGYENFEWTVALSEPRPEDEWSGPTGFVHEVLRDGYLRQHPAPEDCEYYVCGPPLMIRATLLMLEELGVRPGSVHFDDFGG